MINFARYEENLSEELLKRFLSKMTSGFEIISDLQVTRTTSPHYNIFPGSLSKLSGNKRQRYHRRFSNCRFAQPKLSDERGGGGGG